jgi:hypothetical protein
MLAVLLNWKFGWCVVCVMNAVGVLLSMSSFSTTPVISLGYHVDILLLLLKDMFVSGGGVSPPVDSEASRRPSKDESLSSSNSDSQQSGDEYNVYYYDPKALLSNSNDGGVSNVGAGVSGSGSGTGGSFGGIENKSAAKRDDQNPLSPSTVFANLRKMEDVWDVLFARAEGLHAHGHGKEACTLGVRLAKELLANPPDLMVELPPLPAKGKRKKVCERL